MIWILLLGLVGLAGLVGWHLAYHPAPVTPPTPVLAPAGASKVPEVDLDEVIAPAPAIGRMGIRQWITFGPSRLGSWPDFVREFYGTLLLDNEVNSYFPDDTRKLEGHFAGTAVRALEKGVTRGALLELQKVHANVRDRNGRPITGEVFDRVATTLVQMLRQRGAPEQAISELVAVVTPIRQAIVIEEAS